MKIFIYKTIIVLISAIIVFKVTIGQTIKSYENGSKMVQKKGKRCTTRQNKGRGREIVK